MNLYCIIHCKVFKLQESPKALTTRLKGKLFNYSKNVKEK